MPNTAIEITYFNDFYNIPIFILRVDQLNTELFLSSSKGLKYLILKIHNF